MKAKKNVYIIAVVLMLGACDSAPESAESPAAQGPLVGQTNQSDCLQQAQLPLLLSDAEESGSVQVLVEAGTLKVVDSQAELNCCLKVWMDVSYQDGVLDVVEREDPDKSLACFCTCPYLLSVEMSDFAPGSYLVRVYRENAAGDELLHEETVAMP